jgi:hypothetical protein
MAKFNTKQNTRNVKPTTPVRTASAAPDLRTNEGAVAWSREPKSELFLLGVANFVNEDTFYEDKLKRDKRFESLVTQVATTDPKWLEGFFPWLRFEANMRSAPVIGAAIAAKSMLGTKAPGGRAIVAKSLGRADEPGEFLSYWISRWGDKLPKSVKRGLADAVVKLYTQRNLLKYDTAGKGLRFSNVIQLVHPAPQTVEQRELFKFAMERVYKDNVELPETLKVAKAENRFRKEIADPAFDWDHFFTRTDRSNVLKAAGITWEDLLPRVPERFKAQAWEALIPTMGYMALLRNLRNFDEAGISAAVRKQVTDRLADPKQVARSKQFPFRFLSAYRSVRSLNWGPALEAALDASLANVPEFDGRMLVLVDRSGSMFSGMSGNSEVTMADQAALFGVAVAMRNVGRVNLVEFGTTSKEVKLHRGDSMLRSATARFGNLGGTYLAQATRAHYAGQDRVIVITDEQYHDGSAGSVIPAHVPVYTFNLAGYKPAGGVSGQSNRHTFGGLTDKAFKLIPMLEAAQSQRWPWETSRESDSSDSGA